MINKKYFFVLLVLSLFILPSLHADLTTDLVAYYKLDETSGSTAYTSIGDYNLTHFNSPTINQTGKIDKSVLYSASSSQYSKVDSNMKWTGFTNRTISGWIYLTSLPANNTCYDLFSLSNGSNGRALHIPYCNSSGTYTIAGAIDRVMQAQYGFPITITLDVNTWYFVAVVFNNNNVQLFLNDTNGVNTSVTQSNGSSSNNSFRIGTRYDNSYYSNAKIDEVGVWSRALSSSEIAKLYNSGNGLSYPFILGTVTPSQTTGTYYNDFNITLTTDQNNSTGIYYTTNGTTPTTASTQYTGAIAITGTTTLKAVSYNGTNYSQFMTATYTMVVAGTPTADKNAGVYYAPIHVILSKDGTTTGTTLTYTTNGTDPTIASTEYTTPIPININNDANTTLKFAEFKTGYTPSAIQTLEFNVHDANLNIQFYDENTLAKLDGNVSIIDLTNNQTYYADENGLFTRYLTDIDWKEKQINAYVERKVNGVTTHTSRNLQFYWKNQDHNLNFALLPVDLGEDIEFLVKDTNNELWDNKYVQFVNDGNIISSNKTSSTGYFTSYNLSDGDYNAVLYDATGTEITTYQKTTVTIKIPKDEITLSAVSPYDIDVGGLLTYSLSNQSTASTFNIFAGTVDTYSVQVVDYDSVPADREYLPRNYTFQVPFGTSYTPAYSLQPYLLKEVDGVTPTLFVLDKIKRPVEGVIIDIYKNMGGIKTLVESVETTSVGRTSFSAYPLATYTLKMYYQNILKGTYTIQPRSSDDRFYFVLDLIDTGVQPVSVDFSADWANTSEAFNLTTTDPAVDVDLNISSYNSSPVLTSYTLLAYQNEVLIGTVNDVLSGTTDNITDSFNKALFSSRDGLITFVLTVNYSVSGVSYSNTSYFAAGVTENNNSTISLLKSLPDDIGRIWSIILAILITISVLVLVTTTGLVQNQQAITITGILILGVFVFLGWLDTGVSILGTDIGRFVYVVSAIFGMFLMVKEGNK